MRYVLAFLALGGLMIGGPIFLVNQIPELPGEVKVVSEGPFGGYRVLSVKGACVLQNRVVEGHRSIDDSPDTMTAVDAKLCATTPGSSLKVEYLRSAAGLAVLQVGSECIVQSDSSNEPGPQPIAAVSNELCQSGKLEATRKIEVGADMAYIELNGQACVLRLNTWVPRSPATIAVVKPQVCSQGYGQYFQKPFEQSAVYHGFMRMELPTGACVLALHPASHQPIPVAALADSDCNVAQPTYVDVFGSFTLYRIGTTCVLISENGRLRATSVVPAQTCN